MKQTHNPLFPTGNSQKRALAAFCLGILAETVEDIRGGLADSAAGRVKPARKALQALAKKYGSHVHGTGPPLCTHC